MRLTKMLPILALVLIAALAPSLANATVWTLTNANTTATIDDSSQSGMNFWSVDGNNLLYQQWFWYRVGDANPEKSIDTLVNLTNPIQPIPSILQLQYTSPGSFTLDVTYVLKGGLPGSGTADMAEIIAISNIGATPLGFHFFQYTDFDLLGPMGDDGKLLFPGRVVQVGQGVVSETAVVPIPTRYELALFAQTLNALNDGGATTLNNNPAAFGDVTWAFQWDKDIGPGSSLLISKDKHIGVPIPGSVVLLGSGLIGLAGLGWRRRKKT